MRNNQSRFARQIHLANEAKLVVLVNRGVILRKQYVNIC